MTRVGITRLVLGEHTAAVCARARRARAHARFECARACVCVCVFTRSLAENKLLGSGRTGEGAAAAHILEKKTGALSCVYHI